MSFQTTKTTNIVHSTLNDDDDILSIAFHTSGIWYH